MIICFEGPSGIGKTKLGELLSGSYRVVPEVNQLFKNEDANSKYWYYERQVDRYQICKKSKQKSILDGDIFQPIWYNWIFRYPPEFPSREETHQFYTEKIDAHRIAFPDLYFVFQISESELRNRKENDQERKRRNFEKHLNLIQPQKKYFKYLKEHTKIVVETIDYVSIEETREQVISMIESNSQVEKNDRVIFKNLLGWLSKHSHS